MKLADLVRYVSKNAFDWLRIQSRCIRGDPIEFQATSIQESFETAKESPDVIMSRVVVEDFVDQPLVSAIVHDDQHAEGTIIQLIGSDVAAEFG